MGGRVGGSEKGVSEKGVCVCVCVKVVPRVWLACQRAAAKCTQRQPSTKIADLPKLSAVKPIPGLPYCPALDGSMKPPQPAIENSALLDLG